MALRRSVLQIKTHIYRLLRYSNAIYVLIAMGNKHLIRRFAPPSPRGEGFFDYLDYVGLNCDHQMLLLRISTPDKPQKFSPIKFFMYNF